MGHFAQIRELGKQAVSMTSVFTAAIQEPRVFRTQSPAHGLHGRLPQTPVPTAAVRPAARQIYWQGINKRVLMSSLVPYSHPTLAHHVVSVIQREQHVLLELFNFD